MSTGKSRRSVALLLGLMMVLTSAPAAFAATTVPITWEAGGLNAGTGTAGEGRRVATDANGNVTVLSGGSSTGLATVTSYTSAGVQRWRRTIAPPSGHYVGRSIEVAPDGDVVVAVTNLPNSSSTVALGAAVVRFSSTGVEEWRAVHAGSFVDYTRMVLDSAGNAYVVFSFNGTSVRKYSPTGSLLWESAGNLGAVASSITLSPDEGSVYATSTTASNWIVIARNASTGAVQWSVNLPVGVAARDVVADASKVYVAGIGNVGTAQYLTVSAFDRTTGAQLWRTDERPAGATAAQGLWMDLTPAGDVVVAGVASFGFLDWYIASFSPSGTVRWESVRDGGLNTDEVPAAIQALADGSVVVTGVGGPALPGGFLQGVTGGYSSTGELLWEGFSDYAQRWLTRLPNGLVCTVGGIDGYISCFNPTGAGGGANVAPDAVATGTPTSGLAPLVVTLDASASTDADGTIQSWSWAFGDGATGTGAVVGHTYAAAGTYVATVTVTDDDGAVDTASVSITVTAAASAPLHVSSTTGGTVGGVTFADEDILRVDAGTGAWSMFFDGSDVGLSNVDVDAFEVLTDGRILLSTDVAVTLNRIRYDDSDVIVFTPTSTGSTTAGTFAMYASGASLQLTTDAEDVDAIAVTAAGELVLSTSGRLTARGVTSEDEDLTRFVGTTASRYFDGSTIGLTASGEDVSAGSIDTTGKVRFGTEAGFTLTNGLTGSAAAVGSCTPTAVPVTACSATELVAATALAAFSSEVIDGVSVRG